MMVCKAETCSCASVQTNSCAGRSIKGFHTERSRKDIAFEGALGGMGNRHKT